MSPSRTYAETQADTCLATLVAWHARALQDGGVYALSDAETFEFARIIKQVLFHVEREQMPAELLTLSRQDCPIGHACWESYAVVEWQGAIAGSPDKYKAIFVKQWIDRFLCKAIRVEKQYSGS